MERYFDTALNNRGEPSVGLTVTVTDSNGAVATLYSDNGVTQTGNPFYTDKNGAFYFYAANGRYTVSLTADGVAPASIKDVILNDPADKYYGASQLVAGLSADMASTANGKGADLVANATKKVASIAALRALRVPQGSDAQTVIVDNYAATGDEGGGIFYWNATSTAADDGGITINPTLNSGVGRWVRHIMGQAVSVRWFGAKGDGANDDTSAIQNAINSTATTVYFPDGTYLVSVMLNGKSNVSLIGIGYQTATLKASADINSVLYFVDKSTVSIERLTIDGNNNVLSPVRFYSNTASPYGFTVKDCQIKGAKNDTTLQYGGIEIARLGSNRTSNVKVINNYFPSSGAEGVIAAYVDNIDVSGNRLNNIGNDAIQIVTCTEITVHDNICTNMGSVGPGGSGVSLGSYCYQFSVQGNRIDNAVGDGAIAIEIESNDGIVANNTLTNCNHSGIYVSFLNPSTAPYDTIRNVAIVNNVCSAKSTVNTTIGINAYAGTSALGTGLVIKGNVIDGFNQAINVSYFTGAIVADNAIPSLTGTGRIAIVMTFCKYSAIKGNMAYCTTDYGAIQLKNESTNFCDFCTVSNNMILICGAGGNNALVYIEGTGTHSINHNWTGDATNYINCAATCNLQVQGNFGSITGAPVAGFPNIINSIGNNNGVSDFALIGGKRYTYGTAIPTTGTWNQGDHIANIAPATGQPKGWFCERTGQAAPAWAASTAESVGNLIVPTTDNGHYYKCTTAGTTGATQPTWPTTSGATVTDGTVVWTESGTAALFPSEGNL